MFTDEHAIALLFVKNKHISLTTRSIILSLQPDIVDGMIKLNSHNVYPSLFVLQEVLSH